MESPGGANVVTNIEGGGVSAKASTLPAVVRTLLLRRSSAGWWLALSATVVSLAPWLCGAVAESTEPPKLEAIRQFAREQATNQLHDAAQHTAMSTSQADVMQHQAVTPPPRFTDQPLTPPLTDKKPFTEAPRVIALFRQIHSGGIAERDTRTEFQLADGEYDQIESTLQQDDVLSGYVEEKIRYDYDGDTRKLVVRMPTEIHERFIGAVEDDIWSQLKTIQNRSGRKAKFAQKLHPARSTEVRFDASASSSRSKYEPDASFRHKDAKYPGVIVEVAYSQKKPCLGRLAENYILDSDASVRAVVCVHIEYGNKESRKATLSVWRPELVTTGDGLELRAVEEVADEAFRDEEGNAVDGPGLRLRLSEFTYEGLAQKELGKEDTFLSIPGSKLCEYLNAADSRDEQVLGKHVFAKEVKKRKRSATPPEEIRAGDEARYAEEEERVAKRADYDMNYQDKSSTKSLSD